MEDKGAIEIECNKISMALNEPQEKGLYEQLYAAQQALSWAINPLEAKSPYDMIMDIQADLIDCPPLPRLFVS